MGFLKLHLKGTSGGEVHECSDKFLLYYDNDWKCNFFPNYRTSENNVDNIRTKLVNQLQISEDSIELKYKSTKIHQKYSEKHKENRIYEHQLFIADISSFPEVMMQNRFEIGGIRYRWMSMVEMENNAEIRQRNWDIVSFIKENIE